MAGSAPKTASPFSWAAFQSHVRYLGTEEQKKIREAFELGVAMHGGQMRKSGEPYFTHPIAVGHILADMDADADTIIVALLHDALEDTDLSEDEIEEKFGKNVRRMIDALTKLEDADLSERPTLTGQIETIRKLFTFMQEDVRIMVIKLADRLHNMQTVEFLPEERRRALAQETQDVYVKIADRLSLQDLRDELAELCHGVLEPDILQGMLQIRSESERRAQRVIGEMKKAIALVQESVPIELLYEPSRFRKLRRLYEAGGSTVTGVSPFSIVFICSDIATCYQTLGALHQCWRREALSFQDFINAPMINGYQGLHTTMILEDGTRVRCKIRTREMHAYARKGIATKCFDGRPMGLPSYLGWSQRISPLAEGTTDRSGDFWESLQSDILGESIMVYGPGDQAILLPEGSTVLDGAFYFLGDQALKLKNMRMDGREVTFQTPLTNAATIEVELAKKRTVERAWLAWVRTGLAVAKIRDGLGTEPREKKVEKGKELLSEAMLTSKKGLLAEFAEEGLQETMATLGFATLEEGLIAISEGRVEPESVLEALFPARKEGRLRRNDGHRRYRIRFTVRSDDSATLRRLVDVYDHFHLSLQDIRVLPVPFSQLRRFTLSAHLPPAVVDKFHSDLRVAGAEGVSVSIHSRTTPFLMATVIFLWGVNPVLASWFMQNGMSSLALTALRLLTFCVLSSAFFTGWILVHRKQYQPVQGIAFSVLLPAIGIAGMSFLHYLALEQVAPSVHLTVLRLNVLLLPMLAALQRRTKPSRSAVADILLLCGAVAMLLFLPTRFSPQLGMLLSVGALLSYALYSLSRETILRTRKIAVRYPVFLFYVGLWLGLIGLFILPAESMVILRSPLTVPAILYTGIFVFLPHALYASIINKYSSRYFMNLLLLEVPIAILFEIFLLGLPPSPLLYALIGVLTGALAVRWWILGRTV